MCSSADQKFPFEFESTTDADLMKDFPNLDNGLVLIGPKKYAFPYALSKNMEKLYNFPARADDIWIVTYPRSGTTLTQEMVWMIANDLDFARGQAELLTKRSRFFELHAMMTNKASHEFPDDQERMRKMYDTHADDYEALLNMPSPRVIKTHLPLSLLPRSVAEVGAKVIYVGRNPKDVAVSYYYECVCGVVLRFVNDFPRFWDYFERGLIASSPHIEHVEEGWERRDDPNFLFLFYEDLIRDMPSTFSKVAHFLNKSISDADNRRLAEHLNIDNFRKNPAVNLSDINKIRLGLTDGSSFIRKGKSSGGGRPEEFTPELIERYEAWMTRIYANSTLRFPDY